MNQKTKIRCPLSLIAGLIWLASGCAAQPEANAGRRETAVRFSLPTLGGQRLSMDGDVGHPVVLAFWATWCDPCLVELDVLQKIWRRHREQGLLLVGVNVDGPEKEAAVRQLVRRYAFRFPILLDREAELIGRFNPKMDLPYTMVLDQRGHLAHAHQGYRPGDEAEIEAKIIGILRE